MMTKDRIETWRKDLVEWNEDPSDKYIAEVNALCDMALQSLSQESVRSEARKEEVAKNIAARFAPDDAIQRTRFEQAIIDAFFILQQSPARVAEGTHKCTSDKIIRGYQDGYDIGWCGVCGTITWGSDGLIGNELTSRRDHSLWKEKNLIAWSCSREARGEDKCKEWCGHQRYCTAVTKKWSSPESPAKEQPECRMQEGAPDWCATHQRYLYMCAELAGRDSARGLHRDPESAPERVTGNAEEQPGEQFAAMVEATRSHVDGRDLLAELQPLHWHYCNIRVRINGQWKEYEGDWLKRLFKARGPLPPPPERP